MTRIVGPIKCFYCGGRCDDRCRTAFLTEPGVYTYVSKHGVVTKSEIGPHITRPAHMTDDWFRWGHLSFAFESYRMWAGKMRDANPVAYRLLTVAVPMFIVGFVGGLVQWLV